VTGESNVPTAYTDINDTSVVTVTVD